MGVEGPKKELGTVAGHRFLFLKSLNHLRTYGNAPFGRVKERRLGAEPSLKQPPLRGTVVDRWSGQGHRLLDLPPWPGIPAPRTVDDLLLVGSVPRPRGQRDGTERL